MATKETGGPAFPSTFHNGWGEPEKGMTMRDYFASKAMQGLLASTKVHDARIIAGDAYQMADATLKAREA